MHVSSAMNAYTPCTHICKTSCDARSAAALQRVCRLQGKGPEDKCSRWHELWTQSHARTIRLQPRASRQRSRRRTCKAPRCGNPLRVALMSSMQRRIAVYFPDVPAPARCRTLKKVLLRNSSLQRLHVAMKAGHMSARNQMQTMAEPTLSLSMRK